MDKEIKTLIDRIESDSNFQARDNKYFEPWDCDTDRLIEIGNSCYYLLKECLSVLKKQII